MARRGLQGHSRRGIFEAKEAEPQAAGQALAQIAALYKIEEQIRELKLTGEAKRLHRLMYSKPLVDKFFDWIDKQFEQLGLLPSNPLTKALAYVRERRAGLRVFLDDAEVAIDTNHIERALRPIPTGRNSAKSTFMRSRRHELLSPSSVAEVRGRKTTLHSHRPRRNAWSAFGGLYRASLTCGCLMRARARSFIARSASTYM